MIIGCNLLIMVLRMNKACVGNSNSWYDLWCNDPNRKLFNDLYHLSIKWIKALRSGSGHPFNPFTYSGLAVILFICTDIYATDKQIVYQDAIYESQIKTILLFPADGPSFASGSSPVLPLAQPHPLILKFDEINTEDYDNYMAMIIPCTSDWKRSNLNEMEFISEYNEFPIINYEFSMTTKVPFTHYTFALPRVRLPGNYILAVYRDYNKADLILTRRFIVIDQKIRIESDLSLSAGVLERQENHQINFTLDYTNLDVPNPYLDIKVVLRQNQRWDNMIYDLRPSMVREDIRQLVYRHFNFENNFKAGNEFRFFDMRSIRYSGQNIEKIIMNEYGSDAFLYVDKTRGNIPYAHIDDLNGAYYIENRETPETHLESDYSRVHFFLELESPLKESIYIAGKLTDWQYNEENKMRYIEASGVYTCSLTLKQGFYNYCYLVPSHATNVNVLEGNFFQTRNEYEIIVYYHHAMLNTDVVVGYTRF